MEKPWELKDGILHLYERGAVRIWNHDIVMFTRGFIYCKDIMLNIPASGPIDGGVLYVEDIIVYGVRYAELREETGKGWLDTTNAERHTKVWGFKNRPLIKP
jgi:hypothetical protein